MIHNSDAMNDLMMTCVMASLEEFKGDLERRIAVVLRQRSYPREMVVNMAETIGKEVGDWLQGEIVMSGRIRTAVGKLL